MVGQRIAAFAEERAEVEVLLNDAKRFGDLNKKIEASLARMRSTGDVLQQALGPTYSNTQPLHHINNNVNRMLATIDLWQKPLEGKGQAEEVLRNGPSKVGVAVYIASLARVETILAELTAKPLKVNEGAANELRALQSQGNTKLQQLFESTLKEQKDKIEPLHFITKDLPFPTMDAKQLSDLAAINTHVFNSQGRSGSSAQSGSPTARLYARIRGDYLANSLQNLATASISTSRKQKPDELYKRGSSGIGTYASGIEGMFVAECQMINVIFRREERGNTFDITTRKTMSVFSNTLKELNIQIKKSITTDCFLAYEIIDIVTRLAFRLDDQTGQAKGQLLEALRVIRDTAKLSLAELISDIKNEMENKVFFPHDGAVEPYTILAISRLQRVASFPQPFSSFLNSINDRNWATPPSNSSTSSLPSVKSLDVGADSNTILAHYVLDSIEILLTSLEAKAKTIIKNKGLLGVFIANNVTVVDRMIRTSDIANLFASTNTSPRVEAWRKRGTGAYLDSWREPCAALMDVQYTSRQQRPPSNNSGATDSAAVVKALNSKDKDQIKEKFKTFNSKFEELSSKHKEISGGMEQEVRTQLGREIQAMIEPLYARFWDRYHEIDKGKGKYVKYDKSALSAQLATLA